MSKTFTYTKITNRVYLENSDEYEEFGEDFEYEVEDEELEKAVINLVNEYYFDDKMNAKNFKNFVRDFGLLDDLVDGFEDELKDYFEKEAFKQYE